MKLTSRPVQAAAWNLLVDLQSLLYPHLHAHAVDAVVRYLPDDESTCRATLGDAAPILTEAGYGDTVRRIESVLDRPSDSTTDAIVLLDTHVTLSALAGADLGLEAPEALAKRYVEAPQRYRAEDGPSLFLAGGITGCVDWQRVAALMTALQRPEVTVFNPRRTEFDTSDPNAEAFQVDWEFEHLRFADAVVFWFPASTSDQPIALFELGAALERGATVSVGADSGWHRYANLEAQIRNARPGLVLHDSLKDTVAGATEGLIAR